MSLAKDRGFLWFCSRAGLVLLAVAASFETGCARLQPFHQSQTFPPGSDQLSERPVPSRDTSVAALNSRDPYAAWLEGQETKSPNRVPASGTIVRSSLPVRRLEPGQAAPVQVALAPPLPLRGATTAHGGAASALADQGLPPGSVELASAPPPAETALSDIISPLPTLAESADSPAISGNASGPGFSSTDQFRQIVTEARARIEAISSYQLVMSRQERVGDSLLPAEDVVLSIRRHPLAVRLEWRDGPNQGREVLYNAGGPMHIHMPNNPLMPRMSLAPDSPLALRSSRHPIDQAGLENLVRELELTLEQEASGKSRDQISYGGLVEPSTGDQLCHKLLRITATGETWQVYIDAQTALPFMVQGNDAQGQLLEKYIFRDVRVELPDLAAASAFDPDARWGQSRSLLSRLARSGDDPSDPDSTAGTTVR